MLNYNPLPTSFYPFLERSNWKYWYQLSNESYQIKNHATLLECIKMYVHCKKYSIPFKAYPRGKGNKVGIRIALTLLVLKRVNCNKGINWNLNTTLDDRSSSEDI